MIALEVIMYLNVNIFEENELETLTIEDLEKETGLDFSKQKKQKEYGYDEQSRIYSEL